jgi:hypothetical protein
MSDASGDLFPTFGRSADAFGRFMRSRGMRWFALCVVGGFLFLAGLHGAAVLYEKAKVNAKVAELKAEGQPVVWTELVPKAVPEDQNAWALYSKAADLIRAHQGVPATTPFYRLTRYSVMDWRDPARMAAVTRLVAEDMDALALVKAAAGRPQCWFEEDWSDPVSMEMPHTSAARELARLAGSGAIVASAQGDQGEAVDRLRAGFALSRYVSSEPCTIDELTAFAIDSLMSEAAGKVVGRGPVPEDKARALAGELSSGEYIAKFVRAEQMERGILRHVFDDLRRHPSQMGSFLNSDGQRTSGAWWWCCGMLMRPVVYADELVYLEYMDKALASAKLPWRETDAAKNPGKQDEVDVPDWAAITQMLAMSPSKSAQRRDEAVANRALVGAALGIELYKQKVGRYPATLDDVRKAMAWEIEPDPFSGEDLIYRPIGTAYLLYSIGPDLKDDGGQPMYDQLPRQDKPQGRNPDREHGDIVWMGTWKGRK